MKMKHVGVLLLTLCACTKLPGSIDQAKDAGNAGVSVPGALGVANSVQQVYHPGNADAFSTAIPLCSSTVTKDCYDGPLLTVQAVGSSRVDLQACKLEYSIVSPK